MTATVADQEEIIRFSEEQQRVLRLVRSHQNVFFTGPAGTGKSVLLREIIKDFRDRLQVGSESSQIAITAPTGMAGLNIGGKTLHSFAGVGLAKDNVRNLVEKMTIGVQKRWRNTQVLVIDEISMVDGSLFDKLEEIARVVRKIEKPFGGIQLVICGDFFQLPPVPEHTNEGETVSTFAFEAKSWRKCIPRPTFLSQVFRQKDDEFVKILTGLRNGILTEPSIRLLEKLDRPRDYKDGIDPVEIYPVKAQVDTCNSAKLVPLPGPQHVYMSMDSVGYDVFGAPIDPDNAQALLDKLISVSFLSLKVGAQVMLIQNCVINQGKPNETQMVNGSLGKVIEFITKEEAYERRREDETCSLEVIDPRHTASPTSLSSTRPLNGHEFKRRQVWPLVLFENGRQLLCPASIFTVEGFTGNVEVMRIQVPLILAWAFSVHKSQGQTLNRAKVDLGRTFETGQAYVAISRVTSMEGLELTNFHPSKIKAHPRVVSWSRAYSFGEDFSSDDSDSEVIE